MEVKQEFVDKIAPLGEEMSFTMGDVIFKEGEKADKVFVVISGHASVFKRAPGEEEVFVGLAGAGSVFGEMATFLEGERTATVRASSNLKVLVFDTERFLEAVSSIPELALSVMKEMSKRIHNLNRRIVNITTSKLMYVVGMYLLENLKMEESPYYTPEEGRVELHLKRFSIEYGMEPSKVESIIHGFEKAGILQVEKSTQVEEEGKEDLVYILRLNPDKLRSYLRSIAYV